MKSVSKTVQVIMKSKVLILGIVLSFLFHASSPAMLRWRSAAPKQSIAGIEAGVVIAILGSLGPVAREALRQVVMTPFWEYLKDMRQDAPRGLEWRDGLAVVRNEPFEQPIMPFFRPVKFRDWEVMVDSEGGALHFVRLAGNHKRTIHVGRSPGQPVTTADWLYVNSLEGLIVINDKLESRAIKLGDTPQEPLIRGRWIFVANQGDGTVSILDRDLGHEVVKTLDLDGRLWQPEIVGDELRIPAWKSDGTEATVVLDLGGWEDIQESALQPVPQEEIRFFQCLGPFGRQCLRQTPNVYRKWLIQMQQPALRGFNWVDTLTTTISRYFDLSRSTYHDGLIYAASDDCVFATVAKTDDVYIRVKANSPRKPVVLNNRIYVAVAEGVMVFDKPFMLVRAIMGVGASPQAPTLTKGMLYIASSNPGFLYYVLEETLEVVGKIKLVGKPQRPIAHDGRLYVKFAGCSRRAVIDFTAHRVIQTQGVIIPLEALTLKHRDYAYLVDDQSARIAVFDGETQTPVTTIFLAGHNPRLVFVGKYLFVLTCENGRSRITIVDPDQRHQPVTMLELPGLANQMLLVEDELWLPQNNGDEHAVAKVKLGGWL